MPAFGPRIGIEDIDARQRRIGQPGQQLDGVTEVEADVLQLLLLDRRQHLGHAVDEGLAADEARVGMRARLRGQMFAAAEPDLEPYAFDRVGKQSREIRRGRGRAIKRKPRQ